MTAGDRDRRSVRCSGLTVELGGRPILDRLDLQVGPGSVCAVVGASGSGKTTLLRTICGLTEPAAGTIELGGVDVAGTPPERRSAVLLFQEPRLFPSMTVADNVGFAWRVAGRSRRRWRPAAERLLAEVGLADRADDPVVGLSGGEQQRVALARALCAMPSVLLLDEPFASVDAPRRAELRALVAALGAAHGMTLVVVTHDVRDARDLADTMAVLIDGRIVQHDTVDAVLAQPRDASVAALTSVE